MDVVKSFWKNCKHENNNFFWDVNSEINKLTQNGKFNYISVVSAFIKYVIDVNKIDFYSDFKKADPFNNKSKNDYIDMLSKFKNSKYYKELKPKVKK